MLKSLLSRIGAAPFMWSEPSEMSNLPLDPSCYGIKDVTAWRKYLKEELLEKRNYKSDFSGKNLSSCHMHEGILTRANVPRSLKWHILIYHEYNCFLLLEDEHIPQAPSREWCIKKSYELYGRDKVRFWYYHLPFKVFPFQLP